MIDERFARSADMRLLELQREALGLPPRVIESRTSIDLDPPGSEAEDDIPYTPSGTVLVATLDAQPRAALIPGALVTICLAVVNDGALPARDVRFMLPLPPETAYRPGTFSIDGASAADADAIRLFEAGAVIGGVAAGARRTLGLKLIVEAGASDITLTPQLSAAAGAVLGLRALRLTRAPARAEAVAARPFYEFDESELAAEPLATLPPKPAFTILQPPELPPVLPPSFGPPTVLTVKSPNIWGAVAKPATPLAASVAEVVSELTSAVPEAIAKIKPPAKLKVKPKPQPVAPVARLAEPPKIEVVRSREDSVEIAGRGGPVLTVSVDRKRLAALNRLFGGASLGMIAHYLVLNALAAKDALPGDGADGSIAAFVANQEQLLSRALIATRMGKTPQPDSVGAALPPLPPALAVHADRPRIAAGPPGEAVLVRAFTPSDIMYLQRSTENEQAAPFLRAARLFIGLCANDGVAADGAARRDAEVALTAYAALANAEIGRIFLRGRLTGSPELFKPTSPDFDAAARTVLTTLGRLIA
jgi:hypothetical protein